MTQEMKEKKKPSQSRITQKYKLSEWAHGPESYVDGGGRQHTQQCSGITPSVRGIEPRLATCRASTLPVELSLSPRWAGICLIGTERSPEHHREHPRPEERPQADTWGGGCTYIHFLTFIFRFGHTWWCSEVSLPLVFGGPYGVPGMGPWWALCKTPAPSPVLLMRPTIQQSCRSFEVVLRAVAVAETGDQSEQQHVDTWPSPRTRGPGHLEGHVRRKVIRRNAGALCLLRLWCRPSPCHEH